MIIHCSNPTCAASISVQNLRWDANPETVTKIATEHYGWPTEQHADDDRPRIYCPRCKLNNIAPLLEGLKLIDGGSCECYVGRHGPGYFCFNNGKTAPAEFGADRACDSCIAHRALEQYEASLNAEPPHPHDVPRIITEGDVLVQTVNGWVIIERDDPFAGWVPWAPTFTAVDEQPWTPKIGDRVLRPTVAGIGTVTGCLGGVCGVLWDHDPTEPIFYPPGSLHLVWRPEPPAGFGPPDMGSRALPQPLRPNFHPEDFTVTLDDEGSIQLRHRLCRSMIRWRIGGAPLSWFLEVANEHLDDCEGR